MTWDEPTSTAIHHDIMRGLSYSQIAKKYGTTKNAVAGMAHRTKIGKYGWEYKPRQKSTGHTGHTRSWDEKVFEPWERYSARKKMERMRA